MKKLVVVLVVLILVSIRLFSQSDIDIGAERTAVQNVIQEAYEEGLINIGNVNAVQKGFHPGFAILGISNNSLWKYPIYSWIESVEQRKKEGKYPPEEKVTFQYPLIDITGNAAIAKIEFFEGERLKYTDYLSLYKFEGGWKIVNKIFFEHKEE
ncbi:MAG: nuclear transport factor 2 family protein [Gemmatimonadota bacterium]|nr:MAG: nuclear transport factor 2 family protein [Gemmatimonadota bacterium]